MENVGNIHLFIISLGNFIAPGSEAVDNVKKEDKIHGLP